MIERASGEHTYFASDIAYHQDKRERGYDLMIDVWGADHHGYVARVQGAFQALGGEPGQLELLIMQFVHLVEGGERGKMSKRAGEFVTLDDLRRRHRRRRRALVPARALARHDDRPRPRPRAQRVGREPRLLRAVRACADRLGAAPRPARSASRRRSPRRRPAGAELHPSERELVRRLLAFPDEVAEAAARRAPHRIAAYALETAQAFSAFYRDCQVVGAEPELETQRLRLCVAAQRTLARSLDLLGVTAPQEM